MKEGYNWDTYTADAKVSMAGEAHNLFLDTQIVPPLPAVNVKFLTPWHAMNNIWS